jgi:hypothetical protein
MPATKGLVKAFADENINSIAIVDDGYDTPSYSLLESNIEPFGNLRLISREVLGDPKTKEMVDPLLVELTHELPEMSDLDGGDGEDLILKLWLYYLNNKDNADKMSPETLSIYTQLNALFKNYFAKNTEKRTQLKFIEDLILETSGKKPVPFKSHVSGEELSGYDLIFLDFFLDDAIPANSAKFNEMEKSALDAARKKSIDLAIDIIKARGKHQPVPLFILISTIALPENAPSFRDEAGVLASKFRFVSKNQFRDDKTRSMIVITELLNQRKSGDALDLFLDKWNSTIEKATKQLLSSVRRLDVSDYSYINIYRLKDEKISIGPYILNMYNSLLGSYVEEDIFQDKVSDLLANLHLEDPSPSHLGPSDEVTEIYSRITASTILTLGLQESSAVWAGDLFVLRDHLEPKKTKTEPKVVFEPQASGKEGAAVNLAEEGFCTNPEGAEVGVVGSKQIELMPDILAVITPSCDLVPGRVKVNTVTLIAGKLSPLGAVKKPSSHLIVLDNKKYQVDWNGKWPVTYNHSMFNGSGIDGTDYIKIGRLRSLYHLELQNIVTGQLSGVGVPVTPPIAFGVSLKVLAKPVKGDFIEVADVNPEMGMAWAMYTARNSDSRTFVFDESFRWYLRDQIKSLSSSSQNVHADCLAFTDDLTFLNALKKPLLIKGAPACLPGFTDTVLLKRVSDFVNRDKKSEDKCYLLFLFMDVPVID